MKYTKEQLLEIYQKEHVENKLKYSQIKQKYGIPRGTWDYHIRKMGKYKADTRTYRANDDFFDVIDSEIKAYLLGFLYADGYLASDGRIGIRLQIDDEEIIHLIKTYICPTSPIQYTNNQNFKRNPQITIRWKSDKMYKRLQELGFCVNKTQTDSDILLKIPEEFKHHFIRGYTDGDGHISAYFLENGRQRKINIAWSNGSSKILLDIMEYFKAYKSNFYNHTTWYLLSYDTQKEVYKIVKTLYENSNFYLKRKFDTYLKLKNYYN